MKNIKTIKQLQAEKRLIAQRQEDLEKMIRLDWVELKKSLTPEELFLKKTGVREEKNGKNIIGDVLSQLAATLAGKLAEKAAPKIYRWFKK